MPEVYLSIGSNLGDREDNIWRGIKHIALLSDSRSMQTSRWYETEPWGRAQPGPYLNLVAKMRCRYTPHALLNNLKEIEILAGRDLNAPPYSPRPLDIDILIYGDTVINTPELTIPHQHLTKRRFVLIPLADIAPDLIIPHLGITVAEVLENCPDQSWARALE